MTQLASDLLMAMPTAVLRTMRGVDWEVPVFSVLIHDPRDEFITNIYPNTQRGVTIYIDFMEATVNEGWLTLKPIAQRPAIAPYPRQEAPV